MCNTPKYAKLEERTGTVAVAERCFNCVIFVASSWLLSHLIVSGYGGGFNERENVEYIEREESDGEYDEVSTSSKHFLTT